MINHHPSKTPTVRQSPNPDAFDLLDALHRAIRHGRPDLARRLRDRLIDPAQELRLYNLADAAGRRR